MGDVDIIVPVKPPAVNAIKIDEGGRYVVKVVGPADATRYQGFVDSLRKWWKSGEKFFCVQFDPSSGGVVDVRFERVHSDGGSENE